MSRIAKLKPEKSKVKLVFRLQFHATNIPQPGWDKLFVSFIPVDSGKASAKTTKANVKNGACKWSDPIYETAKLLQNVKSKKFDEKFYKLVVEMGSARSNVLGETTINLADYVDSSKPYSVVLPLEGCSSGAILHATIQLLTSKTGFREFEKQRELREKGFVSVTEPTANDPIERSNPKVKFKSDHRELPLLEEEREVSNDDHADSAVGIDGSSNTSGSLHTDKHDISMNYEVDSLKSTMSGDLIGFSLDPVPQVVKENLSESRTLTQGSHEWVHGWSSDYSMDNDMSTADEDNNRFSRSLEIAEASIQELKIEISSLQSHTDIIGVETQNFGLVLASEIASSEKLSSEVSILKAECSKLKNEVKNLSSSEEITYRISRGLHPDENNLQANNVIREKVSSLMCELEESKSEREDLIKKMNHMECYYEALLQEVEMNQKQLVDELQKLRNEHSTCLYRISSSEAQLEKVHVEMREQHLRFVRERQELDILNKKLEKKAAASEAALKKLRLNYSVAVEQLQKDLELLSFQVISMFETNENLAKQAFEEASQNTLLDFMQEEFLGDMSDEHLMTQMCDSQVMEIRKSGKEGPLGLHGHPNSSREILVSKLHHEVNAIQNLDEESLSKKIERSVSFQEELLKKAESELSEMCKENLHLGVFSIVLQQSLYQAIGEMNLMEDKINNLSQLLKQSTEDKELLYLKLQSSFDDIEKLRESETRCLTKCNSLVSQNHILEETLQTAIDENCLLAKKLFDSQEIVAEHAAHAKEYETERKEMKDKVEETNFEKMRFEFELDSSHKQISTMKKEFVQLTADKNNAEKSILHLENNLRCLVSNMVLYCSKLSGPEITTLQLESMGSAGIISQLECLQKGVCEQLFQISQDKTVLEKERENAESKIILLQQKYDSDTQDLSKKFELARLEAEQHGLEVQSLIDKLSEAGERQAVKNKEMESKHNELENELMNHIDENKNLKQQIQNFEDIIREFEKAKISLLDDMKALEAEKTDSSQLTSELCSLKENTVLIGNELLAEKNLRSILELKEKDYISEINYRQQCIDDQNAELLQLNKQVMDLELNNLQLKQQNEKLEICHMKYVTTISDLETSFVSLYEHFVASEIELLLTKDRFSVEMLEFNGQIESLKKCNEDFQLRHLDVVNTLANFRSIEELYIKENGRLSSKLVSLETQLQKAASEKSELTLQSIGPEAAEGKVGHSQERQTQDAVLELLESEIQNLEKELEYLKSSRDELDIEVIVLRSKLHEQQTQISLMQELHDKMAILREEHNVLTYKLSEQSLKTEEFKNLSIHLRELKDKAEAECLQACEKGDNVMSVAQESLRIAFIREQCESKVQEVRNQLYASKRHGEEMLLKLQNAVDEIESRKKCEAALAKKNVDLSEKILKLDKDLQLALAENRERANTFDRMNAQLECSMISLDCCKEEKLRLENSLQQCSEDRTKLGNELSLLKDLLESSVSLAGSKEQKDNGFDPLQIPADNRSIQLSRKICQDASQNGLAISLELLKDQDGALENSMKQITQMNEKFREGSLKPSIDSIQRELERLKVENSNSLLPSDDYKNEPGSSGLQELVQLDMVNERLGNMFPSYKELSGSRNAVEKVLALEIELAEALESRKKSHGHFQSTLLKQHKDDEVVFQSFRDINELIKDMVEMKRRHEAMDNELKEMHGRYSELSLRFAEVEGERQKLVMALKNIKLPKRL